MPSPIPITTAKGFWAGVWRVQQPTVQNCACPQTRFTVIHWRELQAFGSGGFGLVFKGTYFDQTAVVKKVICVKNKLASRQSFWAELTAAHLHHQNILRVTAVTTCTPTHLSTKDNIGTIVMEFAGVLNLQQVIYGLVAFGQVREIFSGHRARAPALARARHSPLGFKTCQCFSV